MVRFYLFNIGFFVLILVWFSLGILPWLESRAIKALDQDQTGHGSVYRLPFDTEFSRKSISSRLLDGDRNYEEIELEIMRNLRNRPFLSYSWLDLANIKYLNSKSQESKKYLNKAYQLWPNISHSLYLIGSSLVKIQENEAAIKVFGRYLSTNPSQIETVMLISSALEKNTDHLIDVLFSADSIGQMNREILIEQLLYFAIRNSNSKLANSLWNKFSTKLLQNKELSIKYVNFLINNSELEQALSVWDKYTAESSQTRERIINPGFEAPISNGGFGWNIRALDKVESTIDSDISFAGENSLKLEFNGNENIDYLHAQQMIPVEPGSRYRVSFYSRGQSISTRSTPYLELASLRGGKKVISYSDSKKGNWSWEKFESEIQMPESSSLLRIRIKRNKTDDLDKNISFSIWFDEFKIDKILY